MTAGPLSAQDGSFGAADADRDGFSGRIYALPKGTDRLPDFRTLSPIGTIYARRLDVAPRTFDAGFPGVTDRFEWFAISYSGLFEVPGPGTYRFRLLSDDGGRVIVDDQLLINNDGIHPPSSAAQVVELSSGVHCIRVDYFQGPRHHIALQLFVSRNGEREAIFDMAEFGARVQLWWPPLNGAGPAALVARPGAILPLADMFERLRSPPALFTTPGRASVAPDIAIEALRNLAGGRHPWRPDLGRVGRASWFVTSGDPYVGPLIERGASLPVEVMLDTRGALVIDGSSLEAVHREVQLRVAREGMAEYGPRLHIENPESIGDPNRFSPRGRARTFSFDVERVGQGRMWPSVGEATYTHPSGTARVILRDSYLSEGRNGEFVVTRDAGRIRLADPVRVHQMLFDQGYLQDVSPQVAGELRQGYERVRSVQRVQTVFRWGGRVFLVAAAVNDAVRIYKSPDKPRTVTEVAGGWAGAAAAAGAFAAWWTPADVAGPVAWVIHGVGTLVAGGIGYFAGSWLTGTAYDGIADLAAGTSGDTQCFVTR